MDLTFQHNYHQLQEHLFLQKFLRITSYNVCYTKLLRVRVRAKIDKIDKKTLIINELPFA